jgi:hypothetical protein
MRSAWGWSGTCLFGAAPAMIALLLSRDPDFSGYRWRPNQLI